MFCLPVVAEADYEELERAGRPHFPRTYEKWLALSAALGLENEGRGIARIRVVPREFASFMRGSNRPLDVQALLEFAAFNPWHDPD